MKSILIRDWNAKLKIYEWADQELAKRPDVDAETSTQGFRKRFLFGKHIVVYKDQNDVWLVSFKGNELLLSNFDSVNVSVYGPLTILKMVTGDSVQSFIDFDPLESLTRVLDPTYDYLDELETFGYWLVNVYKGVKGSDTH